MQSRRRLISALGAGWVAAFAGCTSSGGSEISDADGDGTIDSKDYAPQDPDVQRKSDLEGKVQEAKATMTATPNSGTETPTSTPPPTATPTPTSTPIPTPTSTPEPELGDAPANQLTAYGLDDATGAYIQSYGPNDVTIHLDPDDLDLSNVGSKHIEVMVSEFPSGSLYAEGVSPSADGSRVTSPTVALDWNRTPDAETPLHVMAFLVPDGETLDSAETDAVDYIFETDPFQVKNNRTIERIEPDEFEGIAFSEDGHHSRTVKEGMFSLTFSGQTKGEEWLVEFSIFKSAYLEALNRSHARSRSEFVAYESANGFASELAALLEQTATENGFTEKREQVEFVIDFVQYLPYVPDDVSKGHDDYTKFSIETLVELGGDCEDSSVMLCGLLQSEPLNYDMVLIQPPGHMAAGIYGGDDLPGYYWELDERKYYYIETTGVGWAIGDVPDEYDTARVIQV